MTRHPLPITVGTHRTTTETDHGDHVGYTVLGVKGYRYHDSLSSARSHVAREIVRLRRELRAAGIEPVITIEHTSHRKAGW